MVNKCTCILLYLLKRSGFVANFVVIIFKFSEVSWTGTAAHSGALVTNACMLYQWSCQCDGAPPEVSLPTSLNAEVQVSLFTLKIELYDATFMCSLCNVHKLMCNGEIVSLSLSLKLPN
jgi:hypothetical protein